MRIGNIPAVTGRGRRVAIGIGRAADDSPRASGEGGAGELPIPPGWRDPPRCICQSRKGRAPESGGVRVLPIDAHRCLSARFRRLRNDQLPAEGPEEGPDSPAYARVSERGCRTSNFSGAGKEMLGRHVQWVASRGTPRRQVRCEELLDRAGISPRVGASAIRCATSRSSGVPGA